MNSVRTRQISDVVKIVLAVLVMSCLQIISPLSQFSLISNAQANGTPFHSYIDTITINSSDGLNSFGSYSSVDSITGTSTIDSTTAVGILSAGFGSVSYETQTVTIFLGFNAFDVGVVESVTITNRSIETETVRILDADQATDSLTATLAIGSNIFDLVAYVGGDTHTATLTIDRSNPDLRISFGYLSTYDSVTARYGLGNSASFDVSSLSLLDSVTAISLSQVDTITVNGLEIGSGNDWEAHLAIGEDNTVYVVTKAKPIGSDAPLYETTTVTIRVPALSDLASSATLAPTFNSFTKSYTVSVANTVSSITFTPTTGIASFVDSITVAGESVTSTVASSPIALSVGANTVSIVVTATNDFGTTSYDTYTVTVTREAAAGGGGGGGGGSPAPTASGPILKSQSAIKLSSSVTSIEFGGTFKLSVSGGESSGSITYSASGDALCAIDSSGNVTALGKGTCTIIATKAGDSTYASATSNSVTVTVTDITVAGVVAVGEVMAPTLSISKPVAGTTTLRFEIDPIYSGDRVSVLLGTKVNGKTTYKTLGSATVSTSGAVTFKSKVKFNKGNLVRLKYGSTVIITKTV